MSESIENPREGTARSASRRLAFLAVMAVAFCCTACSSLSCNKGKIEGTWKLTHSSIATESDNAALKTGAITLILRFDEDGSVRLTGDIPGLPPESVSGSYSLWPERIVVFSDFPELKRKSGGFLGVIRGKEFLRITISGDDMTIVNMGETLEFVRVK